MSENVIVLFNVPSLSDPSNKDLIFKANRCAEKYSCYNIFNECVIDASNVDINISILKSVNANAMITTNNIDADTLAKLNNLVPVVSANDFDAVEALYKKLGK